MEAQTKWKVASGLLSLPPAIVLLGLSGFWLPQFDFLNQVSIILFAGLLVSIGLVLTVRRLRLAPPVAALYVVAAYFLVFNMGREVVARMGQGGHDCSDRDMSVLTMNVWNRNPAPGATARILENSEADVVMLQEARGPGRDVAEQLRGTYPYSADCISNPWCNMAILSKKPIGRWRYHQGRWVGPDPDVISYVVADIDTGEQPMTLATTHLLHLSQHGLQARQIAQLGAAMAGERPENLVIGGDMNLTPWSFALARMDRTLAIPRVSRSRATWPARLPFPEFRIKAPFPIFPIDHVYAGKGWRVCEITTIDGMGSDHYGLMVRLTPARRP